MESSGGKKENLWESFTNSHQGKKVRLHNLRIEAIRLKKCIAKRGTGLSWTRGCPDLERGRQEALRNCQNCIYIPKVKK
jgi:3'-phosphoadenosine 5'-phosphosulfate sulfotransferase